MDALSIHRGIRILDAHPNLGNSGIHDPFRAGQLWMLPRSRCTRFQSGEQKRTIEPFLAMLPFQQRKFGMVAMAELSPARRVHGSVRFHKKRGREAKSGGSLMDCFITSTAFSIILRASSFRLEGVELVTMGGVILTR